ncbi:MAG: hypothetical protein AAB772_03210 [Patescibacteria group bacterium]
MDFGRSKYLSFAFVEERKKRLRVLTTFVGGLIKFVSKVPAMIDEIVHKKVNPRDINSYEIILKDIGMFLNKISGQCHMKNS